MVGYAAPLLSSKLTNVHEYGFFQSPTVLGNSSQISSANKSSPYLFLVEAQLFSECITHYTDSTRSVFVFIIMFITGTSTAAVSVVFN